MADQLHDLASCACAPVDEEHGRMAGSLCGQDLRRRTIGRLVGSEDEPQCRLEPETMGQVDIADAGGTTEVGFEVGLEALRTTLEAASRDVGVMTQPQNGVALARDGHVKVARARAEDADGGIAETHGPALALHTIEPGLLGEGEPCGGDARDVEAMAWGDGVDRRCRQRDQHDKIS
ncbi:MAG TPA: hypothetical protein PK264_20640 [Hyphomicrobiaceae bacterium]|nr:hypothetical protein [Hyphomicrobiaceae bacterium]